MSDHQLATISELAARYFCGWKPKPIGARRFPLFERAIRKALEDSP